jgi:hypothetical protein
MMTDTPYDASFWRDLACAVRQHVESIAKPLRDRIAALEADTKRYKENAVIDRGDYEFGEQYEKGDWVRSGGNVWKARFTPPETDRRQARRGSS